MVKISVIMMLICFVAGVGLCAETSVKQKPKPITEMTKQETIEAIQDALDSEEEVLDFIPEIKKRKDEAGKDNYFYLSGSKEVSLADLEKEVLDKMLVRVNQTATQIRTNHIQSQLAAIQQAHNIQNIQNIQRVQTSVPRPAATPQTPPKPPTLPPAVPPTRR